MPHKLSIRLFLVCSLITAAPTWSDDRTATVQNAAKDKAAELLEMQLAIGEAIIQVKNSIAVSISIIQKYGKSLPNVDAVVEALKNANDAHSNAIASRMKSIAHYEQQNPTSLPAEAYKEIYSTYYAIMRHTVQLVEKIQAYTRSNFTSEFDYQFLTTKDIAFTEEIDSTAPILEQCNTVTVMIEALDNTSSSIGLTTGNKICRALERHVVHPLFKYHMFEIVGISGFALASAATIYWLTKCRKQVPSLEKVEIIRNYLNALEHQKALTADSTGSATPENVKVLEELIEDLKKTVTRTKEDNVAKLNANLDPIARFLQEKLGSVPPVIDGRRTTELMLPDERGWWNSTYAFLCNCLGSDPVVNGIIQPVTVGLFGYYVSTNKLWPTLKNSVKNWWQRAQGGRNAEMNPVGTFVVPADKIKGNFNSVVGLDAIKERLSAAIEYARNPHNFAQFGGRIATNYVFYGIKRTGKSHFASALAGEMVQANPNMKYLEIPSALLLAQNGGVQAVFDLIQSHAPCIAFIDEIDIPGPNRAIGREITGQLLMAMGKGNISPSPDRPVFLIFATNKLEALDTSLISLGRFGATILFTSPSFFDRIRFIEVALQELGHNPRTFDIERLAEKTQGNSFEEIRFSITDAMVKAKTQNMMLSTELILASINEILHGLYKEPPYELHPETVQMLSAHFAGRAIATLLTQPAEMLDTVSICKRKLPIAEDTNESFSGKPTRHAKYNYGVILTRQATPTENMLGPVTGKAQLTSLVAGAVAEELLLGSCTYACESRAMQDAYDMALFQASEGGVVYFLDQYVPEAQKAEYFAKAQALIKEHKEAAKELLTKHRRALEVLARALRMIGTVNDGVVSAIIENPEAINADLDAIEQQRQADYDRMMEQHKAALAEQEGATQKDEQPEAPQEPIEEAADQAA